MPDLEAQGARPQSWVSWLDLVFKATALVYAYLFFTGWVYMVALYGEFNIDVWTLDFPTYTYPVFSIFAFFGRNRIALEFISMVVFAVVSRFVLVQMGLWEPKKWRTLFHVSASVAAFPLLAVLAASAGRDAAHGAWKSSPHVHLTFKVADRQPYEPELLKANDERRLLILTETKDILVVFEAQPDTAAKNAARVVLQRMCSSWHVRILLLYISGHEHHSLHG